MPPPDGSASGPSRSTSDLFVEILRRLRPDLVVERFASEAPPRYHYGRNWGLIRNEQLWALLEKRLAERNAYQGEFFISL